MADFKATPGGMIHRRDQMYRDDGDGTHSETRAANLWVWDTDDLEWRKLTPADFGGGGSVSISGTVTVVQPDSENLNATVFHGAPLSVFFAAAQAVSVSNTPTVASVASAVTVVGTSTPISVGVTNASIPVTDNNGSLTVDGGVSVINSPTVASIAASVTVVGTSTPISVGVTNASIPVTDNSGSLTVDAPASTPVFVRLSDGSAAQVGQKAMTASLPVVVASDQTAISTVTTNTVTSNATLQAGTNLIGRVSASDETSTLYAGTTAITPSYAVISTSASGASTVVSAVTSKKLRVLNYTLVANGAVNVKFQSSSGPTDKTGLLYLAANGGVSSPDSPRGLFETAAGSSLNINLSGAVAVGGHLSYIEVT